MPSNKTPGPYEFTSEFYQHNWPLLREETLEALQRFFSTAFMPTSVNATILVLIPKNPRAARLNEFRPISLCSALYKLITRLLASRLKSILPEFIVPNQISFVKDRLLMKNVLLASEIMNRYHKPGGPKRITLKIDLAKAFSFIRWDFLLLIIKAIDILEKFREWCKSCFCNPAFSVSINGSIFGYFKGKAGLSQGDPLSPPLFVIVMNILSLMLNKAASDGLFGYHQNCESIGLMHLCFADDLLIFLDGSANSLQVVLNVLDQFKSISGYQSTWTRHLSSLQVFLNLKSPPC